MKIMINFLSIALAILFIGGSLLFAKDTSVAYKTKKVHSKSFQDSGEAEQLVRALTKLRCKVDRQQTGDSIVVQYECPRWQSISVSTQKIAHQWEKWLRDAGFEIVHGHSEEHEEHHEHAEKGDHNHSHDKNTGHGKEAENIQYRLVKKVTLHPEEEGQYQELIAILKGLGCTIDIDNHDGHTDLVVQCKSWKHAEFSSHQSAQEWEKWLKGFGFEVKHSHEHH
jgi:hypothetical protein